MDSKTIQQVDVAIIGAGWYGLVAARTYLRLRPAANILVIDSDSTVGGVWSKDRLYPNLVAQVRLGLFNYSDTPMPPNHGNSNDPRVTGEMIHNYMQRYAEDHDLLRRIRFNTFVESTKQGPQGWSLTFRDSSDVVVADKLLVATGVTSIVNMPKFEEEDDASIPIIHSRDLGASFKALEDPAVENVVVVGAAKSAYDAVYLLLSIGKKVTWIIRSGGAGPLAILPFKVVNMFNSIAVASTRLMTHLSPSILNTQGPLYWFFQRSPLGRWCIGRFWDFLDYLPLNAATSVFWANSGLGVVTLPDFWSTLHGPNLTILRDEIRTIKEETVHLKSGSTLQADYAIMCTGWGDHFGMFDANHKAKIGLPAYGEATASLSPNSEKPIQSEWERYDAAAEKTVCEKLPFLATSPNTKQPTQLNRNCQRKWRLYRRAIPVTFAENGDRSIAILGQIHTIQTPLVSEVQSLWAVLYLLGEIESPDTDTMATEVSLWNAWTRRRYLNQGQKFPYSLYDFLPYVDSIFKDLGLESRRKSNAVAELFSPYHPHDFNGFVDEYLAKRDVRKKENK
ncbi:MAG: hypothetical protein Q9217_003455 [Psora testacea]